MGKRWTPEEENYLRDNWNSGLSTKYIAGMLDRTPKATAMKAQKMKLKATKPKPKPAPMSQKTWSKEDCETLEDKWGFVKIKTLADSFQRSEQAIKRQADKMKLGPAYCNAIYISRSKIVESMQTSSQKVNRWIKKFDLPIKERVLNKRALFMIRIDTLLAWLKEHQDLWNANKIEKFAFGTEPDWLLEKRKRDKENVSYKRTWTTLDDSKLVMYHEKGLMQKEIAEKLKRTNASICHRIKFLKKQGRLSSVNASSVWTEEEEEYLEELFYQGLSKEKISDIINKPLNSINYRLWKYGLLKVKRWTKEEEVTLMKLIEEGLSHKAIAQKLERSKLAIDNKSRKLKKQESVNIKLLAS